MLAAGNPAPDLEEIRALLHLRRRRRMIGADRVHVPQPAAQFMFVRRPIAKAGRTSRPRRARSCPPRPEPNNADTSRRSRPRLRARASATIAHPAATTDVHDVQLAAGLARQIDRAANRFQLRRHRTRIEIIAHRCSSRLRARAAVSARVIVSDSACTATIKPSSAARCIPSRNVRSSTAAKSSIPLFDMKAFKPITPRSRSVSSSAKFPGTNPPQSAKSTNECFSAAARFASKLGPSIVGGCAFSGMSKTVVVPPAAAAREPVAKPSHSVRPGSLKWTCASITPGKMVKPVASISCAASRPDSRPAPRFLPALIPMSCASPRTSKSKSLIVAHQRQSPHPQPAHAAVGINIQPQMACNSRAARVPSRRNAACAPAISSAAKSRSTDVVALVSSSAKRPAQRSLRSNTCRGNCL